jgi:hypothetical protein
MCSIKFHRGFKFHVSRPRCPRRNLTSIRDRLVVTLRQHSTSDPSSSSSLSAVTHPIGFYLFHLPPVYVDLSAARAAAAAANAARRAARLAELGGDEHELALEEEAALAEAAATLTAVSSSAPPSTSASASALESMAEEDEESPSAAAALNRPAARRRPIAPSLFPADDVEQMPTRLEGAETLQVCRMGIEGGPRVEVRSNE